MLRGFLDKLMFYWHLTTRDTNTDLELFKGEAAINVTLIIYWYFAVLLPRQVEEK